MKDQLTYKQFNKLIDLVRKYNNKTEKSEIKLGKLIEQYENGKYKNNSVYLTFNNWINIAAKREGIEL